MIENKKILLFGGSGSLGNHFIKTYVTNNKIVNYSRDECKHWKMGLQYKTQNLQFIIGDIRNYEGVETAILREQPDIIIIMAALKHVDRCEYAVNECLQTNCMGPINILNAVEKNNDRLSCLECVVMISTDKACEPTNVYGMAKALAESAVVEKSLYVTNQLSFAVVVSILSLLAFCHVPHHRQDIYFSFHSPASFIYWFRLHSHNH